MAEKLAVRGGKATGGEGGMVVTDDEDVMWRCFWPQCYKEKAYQEHNGFGKAKFPFRSKEYTDPGSVDYGKVRCDNSAWCEERTFITMCHPRLEEKHMKVIAGAIKKVLRGLRKRGR